MESLTREELKTLVYMCTKECAYIKLRTKPEELDNNEQYQNALSICEKAKSALTSRKRNGKG